MFSHLFSVPGAPPRKVEVEALNSTALRVSWKPPLSVKQHGQIRGYQLVYSRLENGEPHGQPVILDVNLPEAQVFSHGVIQVDVTGWDNEWELKTGEFGSDPRSLFDTSYCFKAGNNFLVFKLLTEAIHPSVTGRFFHMLYLCTTNLLIDTRCTFQSP